MSGKHHKDFTKLVPEPELLFSVLQPTVQNSTTPQEKQQILSFQELESDRNTDQNSCRSFSFRLWSMDWLMNPCSSCVCGAFRTHLCVWVVFPACSQTDGSLWIWSAATRSENTIFPCLEQNNNLNHFYWTVSPTLKQTEAQFVSQGHDSSAPNSSKFFYFLFFFLINFLFPHFSNSTDLISSLFLIESVIYSTLYIIYSTLRLTLIIQFDMLKPHKLAENVDLQGVSARPR